MAVSRPIWTRRMLFAAAAVGALSWAVWAWVMTRPADPNARRVGPFLATPYLQLGEHPAADDLTLLWHADDRDADWTVEVRSPVDAPWRPAGPPSHRRIILDGVERHRVYRAVLPALVPGEPFRYRVGLAGRTAFEAEARAKVPLGRPH